VEKEEMVDAFTPQMCAEATVISVKIVNYHGLKPVASGA